MSDTILINRKPAIDHFVDMVNGTSNKRVLRIIGLEKMGKSRLLREYYRLSSQQLNAQCALSDLRSKLQSCDNILFNIAQQLGETNFSNCRSIQNKHIPQKIEINRTGLLFSILNVNNESNKDTEEEYRRRITSAFIHDLYSMPVSIPIVLLFDAFEEAGVQIQNWINEQLIPGLVKLPNIYTVLAGRNLPEIPQTWFDLCFSFQLPPVLFEDQKDYCAKVGIDLGDDVIHAFHEAFEGRPGLFAEYTYKFVVNAVGESK